MLKSPCIPPRLDEWTLAMLALPGGISFNHVYNIGEAQHRRGMRDLSIVIPHGVCWGDIIYSGVGYRDAVMTFPKLLDVVGTNKTRGDRLWFYNGKKFVSLDEARHLELPEKTLVRPLGLYELMYLNGPERDAEGVWHYCVYCTPDNPFYDEKVDDLSSTGRIENGLAHEPWMNHTVSHASELRRRHPYQFLQGMLAAMEVMGRLPYIENEELREKMTREFTHRRRVMERLGDDEEFVSNLKEVDPELENLHRVSTLLDILYSLYFPNES